ncbi:aldo/keto reductase [Streptomyces aculeolatus]|uniref:aldo/keto reductase n=1 Tax=Streptomyces aculeolatus TaxID=270689 RepID=UPI001CECCE91|nr:aldo/keto reductase [Streptomyces aculeolatus]
MTHSPTAPPPGPAGTTFDLGGDMPVGRIGYGTMRLTDHPGIPPSEAVIWEPPRDRAGAVAVLRRAVELGVGLVDTADSYALGAVEEIVAEALYPYADGVVVATKAGLARPGPGKWVPLGRPEYLRQQAELSLRRLRTDCIDLFQLHRVDPGVPLADQVGALRELQEEGKVRHIGLSEVDVDQVREARGTAEIASVQNLYNLAMRQHEAVVDYTAAEGIAFLPYFPMAVGELAAPGVPVAEVAAELGATTAQTALAWLLRRARNVLPIPGTTSLGHLAENVAALDLTMSDDQFARLSALGG